MAILGGLELVAAGVILHKYTKGKERERELERERDRRSRERRHERQHHRRRRDSPPQHMRKEHSLFTQQSQVPRAQSVPPPGYPPNWQPQPTYYPPQPWQPCQNEKSHAWQPQANIYPPTWHAQAPQQSQSQSYQQPQPRPRPQPQSNMYPSHHDDATLSDLLQRNSPRHDSQPTIRTQPRPAPMVPPGPSYAELSADSPRPHNARPNASPHVSFAVPEVEMDGSHPRDPPPAYQPYASEERE